MTDILSYSKNKSRILREGTLLAKTSEGTSNFCDMIEYQSRQSQLKNSDTFTYDSWDLYHSNKFSLNLLISFQDIACKTFSKNRS